MQFKEIINSPFFGNIVGLISLVVGIVSLIWTFFTYRMTKKIENKLRESQAKAINTLRFKEYRAAARKTLTIRREAVKKADEISENICTDLILICCKLLGYKHDILPEDLIEIEELYKRAKRLLQEKEATRQQGAIEFIEITNGILAILEKGEYDL